MAERKASAPHASVVALKIRDFAAKPVGEQATLKTRLVRAMSAALAALAPEDRIVLESAGGAAVVVLGNPGGALEFAQRAVATPGIAVGIHNGPVRVVETGAERVLVGDGIGAADAVAELAPHGRVVAAREFRDALRAAAPDRARHLAPAGRFTDAQDRSHELFFADAAAFDARRRRFLLSNAAIFATIVGGGVIARMAVGRWHLGTATIAFEVSPWADVFIDDTLRGRSPPLVRVALPAGEHSVELHHLRDRPFVQEVDVEPGETIVIRHDFAAPRAKPQQQKPAWRRFLERFK